MKKHFDKKLMESSKVTLDGYLLLENDYLLVFKQGGESYE